MVQYVFGALNCFQLLLNQKSMQIVHKAHATLKSSHLYLYSALCQIVSKQLYSVKQDKFGNNARRQ